MDNHQKHTVDDNSSNHTHLTDEELFLVANDLDVLPMWTNHLKTCLHCQSLLEKEKSMSKHFTEAISDVPKVDVAGKVLENLRKSKKAQVLFSKETLYFGVILVALSLYMVLSPVISSKGLKLPEIPYSLSLIGAITVLAVISGILKFRSLKRNDVSKST